MTFSTSVNSLKNGHNLNRQAARDLLGKIMDDENVPDEAVVQAVTYLTKKGETVDEILGFIDAMRDRMIKIEGANYAIDVCGTGGDKSGTFNISTAVAIVLASGGVAVAKHGNRSASSRFGSADVLETLGVSIDTPPSTAKNRLERQGFVFLFAQKYHSSLKRLAMVRKSLGFPTVFNLLGPLLNPASVERQLVGTFSSKKAEILTEVMTRLDYQHAILLTSHDGLDEASLAAPTQIIEIRGSRQKRYEITPAQFSLAPAGLEELQEGEDSVKNARIVLETLNPATDMNARQRIVALNAALGFYVSGRAANIAEGVHLAVDTLQSGAAARKLRSLKT